MTVVKFDCKRDGIVAAVQLFCTSARRQSRLRKNSETPSFRMIKMVIPVREHCVQLDVENIIGKTPICS